VLENRSPLKISGTLNPLRGDLFMDLTVAFSDIELSPVTPYSGTYLGYSIDKGKLFLDLKYKIENKALEAQNKVFIDQFTFGRKVESDKATNLPVRLAVALLKDSKGEIHLDLPLTGRTDDPKFSVWKVVFQMLRNLLAKAATSPFSLLSSMLGGSEDVSSVSFAPGSATLTAPEQEKLAKLAKALNERPGISLEISGYVDRQRDPDGYRQEQLSHKIRNEKFLALVKAKQNKPEDTQETMILSPEEYSPYLKAVYRKEDFPKPRNALGMIKDLPDSEMKKLLLAHLSAGDKELLGLASDRAVAVQKYLRDQAAMPRERLFLKQDDPFKAQEKKELSASRVEFGVVVK
jgi:outer membrane protein OmpA-like peptidoglycan-associated protein